MMKNKTTIDKIEFNSLGHEIIVIGRVFKNLMSFSTTITLPINWFNIILNHLQKSNPEIIIHDYIHSLNYPDGTTQYELETYDLNEKDIDWTQFIDGDTIWYKIGA